MRRFFLAAALMAVFASCTQRTAIDIDFAEAVGPVKMMHCVNNGPRPFRPDQTKTNFKSYQALEIPYARTHDSTDENDWGGPFTVDVHQIFRNFDADANDPASYDFLGTDIYMKILFDAGTTPFYRLGATIEHQARKMGSLPPRDFKKWAVICEHIIAHYTQGWADGYYYEMPYWEIWNEPNIDADDSTNKRCWGGTQAEFFRLYEIAAKHLKAKFPHLKIGGPAVCMEDVWKLDTVWADEFLAYQRAHNTPIDFFSWHYYGYEVEKYVLKNRDYLALLEKHGYGDAEIILNEWNYIIDWSPRFVESLLKLRSEVGAAFVAAIMQTFQQEDIDMVMYYDARPCSFMGLWSFYTLYEEPPYYSYKAFSHLYKLGTQVASTIEGASSDITEIAEKGLYVTAAKGEEGAGAMVTYYLAEYENAAAKPLKVNLRGLEDGISTVTAVVTDCKGVERPLAKSKVRDGKATLDFTLVPQSMVHIVCSR